MSDLVAFVGISAVVIVTPGPDTALTIRNTLLGRRSGGIATAIGVITGQSVWVAATAVGIVALLLASALLFEAVKLAGAAYLVYLGLRALWSALRPDYQPDQAARDPQPGRRLAPRAAWRQGLLSNLGNPKMAVFFTSLLPQFAPAGAGAFGILLGLGLLFMVMTLAWLATYALVVDRAGDIFRRSAMRRGLEAITGTVLVGLGLRLATESS